MTYTDAAPYDVRPIPSATLSDLRRFFFEEAYLPAAFAPDILEANDRSYEQRLAATKMVVSADEPTPTVLGMLVLSARTRDFLPGAYIQFLRIGGSTLADPIIDEQVIDGAIDDVLRRIDDKFVSHNRSAVGLHQRAGGGETPHVPAGCAPATGAERRAASHLRGDQRAGAGLLVRRPH